MPLAYAAISKRYRKPLDAFSAASRGFSPYGLQVLAEERQDILDFQQEGNELVGLMLMLVLISRDYE